MRLSTRAYLAALASSVLAAPSFTSPAAGSTSVGGGALVMQWTDVGSPALSTFTKYEIALMAGGNDPSTFQALTTIVPNGNFLVSSTAQGVVPANIGGTGTNAYFLRMTATSASGGTLIIYSSRFTLTGMSGKFSDVVQKGVAANAGATAGPPKEDNLSNNVGANPGAAAGNTVPYSLQTGTIRYAPMQGVPPTKITAKTWSPLFPTSAFTVATAFMPLPTIVTTITASQTFSTESVMNTVAAASQPGGGSNAQQRFVDRWKD